MHVTWRGRLAAAAFLAFGLSLTGMGCGDRYTGTEVPDPYEVAGLVQLEDGRPAAGAVIIAFPHVDHGSGAAKLASGSGDVDLKRIDTVIADSKGWYQFDSLAEGRYDLTFEENTSDLKDRKCGRQTRVSSAKNGQNLLHPTTLKNPFQLLASVYDVLDRTPIDSATCEVEGTPYQELTEQGIAHFYLAEGAYSVTCHRSGYGPYTIQLELSRNPDSPSVADRVREFPLNHGDGEVVQPFPATVTAEYDKGTGVVTLTWSKVDFAQLYQYGIRKVDAALAGAAVPSYSFDTLWRDAAYFGQSDTVSKKTLLYTVYALKKDLAFRTPSQVVKVEASRPTAYGADVGLTVLQPQNAYSEGDTLRLEASYRNVFRDNKLLHWKLKDSQDSLRDLALTGRAGTDTLVFPCKTASKIEIGFEVTDVNGVVTSRYKGVEILSRP